MHKKYLSVFLFFVSLLVFLGLNSNSSVNAAEKTYQIGTDVTYPPFEFANSNNKYIGIDLELLNAIAKIENFKVNIKPVGFNAAVQAMQSGQLDGVIAGMAITPERQEKFDFSDPYYKTGFVMAVAKNSSVHRLTQLRGKRVALKTGTAAAAYAETLKSKYGFKTVIFDDSDNMYNDVITGNSVACFEDQPVMQYAIKTGLSLKIVTKPAQGGHYGFAVMKGKNQELLAKFNSGLKKLKANGEYTKIIHNYLGTAATNKRQAANAATQKANHTFSGLLRQNKDALLAGLSKTIILTLISIVCATILGIILGLLGVVPNTFLRGLAASLIYLFRGLPLLVLALFIYNGLPSLTGTKISAFMAGIITLSLNEGAYTAAFVKGGIEAVETGQMEAARSLGLSFSKAMRKIILPQGLKMMIPSFINQFIITLKDTSILSIIGLLELTQTGKIIIARNLEGFRIWTIIAIIYLLLITVLTWLSKLVERKLSQTK